MSPTDDRDIHPADPEWRKIVVLSLVIVCTAVVIAVVLLEHRLGEIQLLAMSSPAAAALALERIGRLFFYSIGAGALLGAVWMTWLSIRILRSDRYPPEGARTIRDLPIARGRPARARAWIGLVFALLFLVAGLLVPRRAELALDSVLGNMLELQPLAVED